MQGSHVGIMKPPSQDRAEREQPASTADTDSRGQRPKRYRSRDLRIDATPEQVAAALGAGPPKAPHEWNYLKRKPVQSDSEAPPRPRSKSKAKRST